MQLGRYPLVLIYPHGGLFGDECPMLLVSQGVGSKSIRVSSLCCRRNKLSGLEGPSGDDPASSFEAQHIEHLDTRASFCTEPLLLSFGGVWLSGFEMR